MADKDYLYLVKVTAPSEEMADEVMQERLEYDEGLAFAYTLAYTKVPRRTGQ